MNDLHEMTIFGQFGDNAVTDVWHFTQGPERAQRATAEQQTTCGSSLFQEPKNSKRVFIDEAFETGGMYCSDNQGILKIFQCHHESNLKKEPESKPQ